MVAEVTNGIKVSVETLFQPNQSDPARSHYFFAYQVTIQNFSGTTVQLMRRHWYIFDSIGTTSEVEGEGVIGFQPVLASGEEHKYISGCNLSSDMGKMYGTYLMENLSTRERFYVRIPEFTMMAPFKSN